MADRVHPSRGAHLELDSMTKSLSFSEFSIKPRPPMALSRLPSPQDPHHPPPPPPPGSALRDPWGSSSWGASGSSSFEANKMPPTHVPALQSDHKSDAYGDHQKPMHPAYNQKPMHPASDVYADQKSMNPVSGTYVIQFPKEQIFSHPNPENSIKHDPVSRRKPPRNPWCTCLCYTLLLLFSIIILAAVATVILYLVFKPVTPKYTVSDVSIRGMNLTSSAPFSPAINVSIRAENPNKKLGIYYLAGNGVEVSYKGVVLSNGVLPQFYQPSKNVTVFQTALKGSGVVLSDGVRSAMLEGQNQKSVPLVLDVKAPVKMKAGAVKTWTITFKVKCNVTVDSMSENSKILSKKCGYKVKLW